MADEPPLKKRRSKKSCVECMEPLSDIVNEKLLLSPVFSDVTLIVGENKERLPAHRSILSQSPVFFAMFTNEMMEAKTGEVTLPNFSAATMKLFLRCLYSGKLDVEAMQLGAALPLLACADHFEVTKLKSVLQEWLSKQLSVDSAVDIVSQARMYHQEAALEVALKYVARHLKQIRPELVSKLDSTSFEFMLNLLQASTSITKGADVHKIILQWCQDPGNREAQLKDSELSVRLFATLQPILEKEPSVGLCHVCRNQEYTCEGGQIKKMCSGGLSFVKWSLPASQMRLVVQLGTGACRFAIIEEEMFSANWTGDPVPLSKAIVDDIFQEDAACSWSWQSIGGRGQTAFYLDGEKQDCPSCPALQQGNGVVELDCTSRRVKWSQRSGASVADFKHRFEDKCADLMCVLWLRDAGSSVSIQFEM